MLAEFVLLAPWALAPAIRAPVEEYLTVPQALALVFPGPVHFEQRRRELDEAERLALAPRLRGRKPPGSLSWFEARSESGELAGYAVVDEVVGKTMPITYLIAVDPKLGVRAIEILAYRESHGGEVRRKAFRDQFVGTGPTDRLELKRDVRNIAGATLSCRALCDGVHDELRLLAAALTRTPEDATISLPSTPNAPANEVVRSRLLMGTLLEIRVATADRELADRGLSAAFETVARLEGLWSDWIAESEISRLNDANGAPLAVSAETFALLAQSRRLWEVTGGAFDPCLGRWIRLWRAASDADRWPDEALLELTRANVGAQHLVLDPRASSARLDGGAALDLGAIGKGAALDAAARVLEGAGLSSALLDFGGQLLALDPPPGRAGWSVAIADPRGGVLGRCALVRSSLSVSANDQRGQRLDGRPVGHILDPHSGQPVNDLLQACALTTRAVDADAWSTALFVLGPELGRPLADLHSVQALWLDPAGRLTGTPAWIERIQAASGADR